MKATIKSIACKILFILAIQSFADNALAHVYLDYPYGGETFQGNTLITLEWHIAIPHNQLNWDLYFSTDGGNSWQPIQLDLPVSQTTYTWAVPSIATSTARISIIQDNTEMDYQDESMNFTIVPEPNTPFIDITAHDMNLDCDISNQQAAIDEWLNSHGGATAVGFCGELTWSHDFYELSNECGATGIAFVTFTAEDECGTAATGAYVRVYDFYSPSIDVAANNLTVECTGSNNFTQLYNWLINHGGAVASDECSNVTWTNDYESLSNECSTTGSATITFTATDACGNSSTTSAIFSIIDNAAPTINIPAQPTTISCTAPNAQEMLQNWLQNHGGATGSDACSNVTWSNNYTGLTDGCGTTGNASVIFIATDACGNSSTTTATFSIEDQSAPTINVPAQHRTISCEVPNTQEMLQNWLQNHGGATATDDCGNVTWSNNYTGLIDGCGITGSATVIFTATDECGNSYTSSADFIIRDNVNPHISIAARDTLINCENPDAISSLQYWLDQHGGAIASDMCGAVSWTNDFPFLADTCDITRSFTVTFTASDECSNRDTTIAVVTLQATTGTINPEFPNFKFELSPNPVSDRLNIVLDKELSYPVHLSLLDLRGRHVFANWENEKEIHLAVEGYLPGIYFLRVESTEGILMKRVVIQ